VANVVDGSLARRGQTVLRVDALNPVGGVDVLDKRDLEAGRATLAGGDGRVSQEIFPDLNNVSTFM
jgi:hypothetical protein